MADTFWDSIEIPFQELEEDVQFVNPVVVANGFMKAAAQAKALGEKMEVLSEQMANLNIALERKRREMAKLRRDLLAAHYTKITKSAPSEVQEAFLITVANTEGRLPDLLAIEQEIERLTRELEIREPRLNQYKARLRMLETIVGWGKQYVDYDKLLLRLEQL